MQNNLALVLEIDRDADTDDRLDLAQLPIRFDPVAHDSVESRSAFDIAAM